MTLLYRFSEDGFIPKKQSFLEEGALIGFARNASWTSLYIPEWREYVEGLYCFGGSLPSDDTIRILLNHLTKEERSRRQWWTAEVADDTLVFDANNLWKHNSFRPIADQVKQGNFEFMIPSQTLKVVNIQEWGASHKGIYPY
jgi:hypothetical protein